MSRVTEAIRNHHRELANALKEQVNALVEGKSEADPAALTTFLKEELLPHMTQMKGAVFNGGTGNE